MSIFNNEDGTTSLSRDEHYYVSGYVTVRVPICYETTKEPGEDDDDEWSAIMDVVGDDFDIVDDSELDYEIEKDDP